MATSGRLWWLRFLSTVCQQDSAAKTLPKLDISPDLQQDSDNDADSTKGIKSYAELSGWLPGVQVNPLPHAQIWFERW